ncbi:5-formyltetrahydrofolate cyclo-ligase [Roseibium salinum]|uniref:5-formyltetrahydrofolate cyclo-ligase n=1 Tax=Roseibium salinum TaxID=1604349 RepID=UPI00361DAA9E
MSAGSARQNAPAWSKRKRLPSGERQEKTAALVSNLRRILQGRRFTTIAAYWPIRGEPDLRPLLSDLCEAGITVLLPRIVTRDEPLQFIPWAPGCDMIRGPWNIPVPGKGDPQVPDLVLSPLVGVDPDRFRLGNGGGYYDRTLVAFPVKPTTIGVGFEFCLIPTIFPMPWDVPMDMVVTEDRAREQ